MPQTIVIGAGHAGTQAAVSLRTAGYAGSIVLLGADHREPYQRPPLSKAYLKSVAADPASRDNIPRLFAPAQFTAGDIDLRLAETVTTINRDLRTVTTSNGEVLRYDSLILATGASPRALPNVDMTDPRISFFNAPHIAETVAAAATSGQRIAVIGAGFIGLEIASALRELGADAVVFEAADNAMNRGMTRRMADYLIARHTERGTVIRVGARIESVEATADAVNITSAAHGTEAFGHVIIGIGVVPNTELASQSGLTIDNGIVVDEALRTSDAHIFAVGDCARYPSAHFNGELLRLESVQNANDQARHVAREIATGDFIPYTKVPWFWTEQTGVRVQMAGITQPGDDIELVGDEASGEFSVFCFRDDRLVAVESVNRPRDHVTARKLLDGSGAKPLRSHVDIHRFAERPSAPASGTNR